MIDVVGVGDDGWAGLDAGRRELVGSATVLFGAPRQLDLVPEVPGQVRRPWPSPMREALPAFLGRHASAPNSRVVALASGDPLTAGIGSTLIGLLGADAVRIHPAVSSPTLARARMGWPAESTTTVSLVARDVSVVRRHLAPGARLVVLCSDGSGPARLADLLRAEGLGESAMTAWWHLGGSGEGCETSNAHHWQCDSTPNLVVICIEVDAAARSRPGVGSAAGRPDDAFEHDGQLTKQEARAAALAALRPYPGAVLWDIGAGSGAIGIEWCLAADRATAVAIERDETRAHRISRNAAAAGVSEQVDVHRCSAGDLVDLPDPAAVFVGGGLSDAVLRSALDRLPQGGRFVAHAVTVESEMLLHEAAAELGGRLVRIGIEHVEPLGRYTGWRPARAVVQWSLTKGQTP